MNVRKLILRLMAGAAPAIAALALAAPPPTLAAGQTFLIDTASPATGCGRYDGEIASTNVEFAAVGAPSGSTLLICPGTYTLNFDVEITGRKLTIKPAMTGPDSRPALIIDNSDNRAFTITNSDVTIDGLVIDGRSAPNSSGIALLGSSATITNTTLIGPDDGGSFGIFANATMQTEPRTMKVSISNSNVLGYTFGVLVDGAVKLSVTGCTFDGTDGGRIAPPSNAQSAVRFGLTAGADPPSGTVSRSRFVNNGTGIFFSAGAKVSVSGNAFFNNLRGMHIRVSAASHADNIKITGNTIMGVPPDGVGILIENEDMPASTVKNLMISKNLISAARYNQTVQPPTAIRVDASAPAISTVTVSVSGNILFSFPVSNQIVNVAGNASVTEKGNDAAP